MYFFYLTICILRHFISFMQENPSHSKKDYIPSCSRRDGTRKQQFKIHVTPSEETYWGIKGGDQIQVFETDVCKIGILSC